MIADPGFEQGLADFYTDSSSVSVERTTTAPITGIGSLSMTIGGYGNVWWSQNASAFAQTYTVAADVRAESGNASDPLQLCATVYYDSGAYDGNCVPVDQTVGVVQHLQVALSLDSTIALHDIHIRVSGGGDHSALYTMDNISAVLTAQGGTAPPSPPAAPPPSTPPASQPDAGTTLQPDLEAGAMTNLVADPGFETSTSGFVPQQSSDSVIQTTTSPLAGNGSLKVSVGAYDNIWWFYSPSGAAANAQQVAAAIDVRIDADPSATTLSVCAVAYYGSTLAQSCASAPMRTGTVTHLAPTLATDPTQTITRAGFRIVGGNGGAAIAATLDSASFVMTPESTSTTATSAPAPQPPTANASADVVISWSSPQQTIDGFGASNAFTLNAMTAADADRFFGTSSGIGLTILRVGISPTGGLLGGAWSDGTLVAMRGGRVIATPWTAPAEWKSNGSTTAGGTLLTSHYSDWASVIASFLGTFEANAGINVYAVSLQNEPDLAVSYESMAFSVDQLAAFARVLSPMLAAMSPRPKLMMGEYSTWNSLDTLTNYLVNNDTPALGLVDIFGIHQYGSAVPTPFTSSYAQPLWETEVSSYESFDPSITNGLGTAEWINDALTTGNATAWLCWWMYGQNADNEGLVGSSDHPGQMTKRYYALGNFSKFVRPGWVRLATTGTKAGIYGVTAFKDPVSGSYAIVIVNASGAAVPITLGISDATSGPSVVPYATYDDGSGDMTYGSHGNLQPQPAIAVSPNGTFSAVVPAGVTTFVGTAQ